MKERFAITSAHGRLLYTLSLVPNGYFVQPTDADRTHELCELGWARSLPRLFEYTITPKGRAVLEAIAGPSETMDARLALVGAWDD